MLRISLWLAVQNRQYQFWLSSPHFFMKQLLTIFLLLVHVNSAMLLPQVEDQGMAGTIGSTCDVVNSVYEWVDETLLDHHDSSTQDHHDVDDGLQIETAIADDFCSSLFYIAQLDSPSVFTSNHNAKANAAGALEMSYELNTPPPEA